MRVARKNVVQKKTPNLLAPLFGVERFVLRVADAAKLPVGRGRLGSVTSANQLHDAIAAVNLLAEHRAQITLLGAEDVLPDWFVAEKLQRVGNQLARAFQLLADG